MWVGSCPATYFLQETKEDLLQRNKGNFKLSYSYLENIRSHDSNEIFIKRRHISLNEIASRKSYHKKCNMITA